MNHNRKMGMLAALSLGLVGMARGDDDVVRLERQKAPAEEFSHAERAKAADGDLEDVHFRYFFGYLRGSYGGQYYLPRLPAFRRGFSDGSSGAGYQGGAIGRAISGNTYAGNTYAGNAAPMNSFSAAPGSRT